MARKGPESEPVLTIGQLVQAHLDNGHTLRQLEAASGHVVAYQHFDKLAKGAVTQWPRSAEAIEATARALDLDVRQVVLAYAAQFGIDVRDQRPALAAMLPAGTERLTIRQARAIAALVASIVEHSSEGGKVATMPRGAGRTRRGSTGPASAPLPDPNDYDQAAALVEAEPIDPGEGAGE